MTFRAPSREPTRRTAGRPIEKMKQQLEQKASEAVKRLLGFGTRSACRKAAQLGDTIGAWRRGRVGDCLLAAAVESANNWMP